MFEYRRIGRVALTIALALSTIGVDVLFSQGRQPERGRRIAIVDGREVVEGEVIVRYRAQSGKLERDRAEFQADSDLSEAIGRAGARRMRSRHLTTRQLLETLRENPDVEFVEPNFIIRASATPNDTSMSALWGLVNTGQVVDGHPGTPGADIGAAAAWDVTTGSRANVVAIIDTGLDFNHPDLAANVFSAPHAFSINMGSFTVTCGAGTHGYNALADTCVPFDDSGHGTHVAGIIGAVGNNNTGVTGVNWTTTLMPLKVLGADGTGTTSDAIEAIEWVIKAKAALGVDANVRVLNASWGGIAYSEALNAQIQAANTADMLFVAAAGSDGNNNDVTPHYPASSTSSNVISVAATDNSGAIASFSNYGATTVHLAAPGASTLSTLPNNEYGYLSGTSMSAPFVAGAAALVLSVCPSNTATLKSTLLSSVDPDATLAGKTISGGRLNVSAAIQRCRPTGNPSLTIDDVSITEGNSGTKVATFTVTISPVNPSQTVTVNYATSNGTATTAGNDYVATSGTLTFAPSITTRTISVTINGDTTFEPNETFMVTLSGATNAGIGDVQATGTIVNDDTQPPSVNVSTLNVNPGGTINFTVTNGPANRTDWVSLNTASGADTPSITWMYLNGSNAAPATGTATASLQFTAPTTPGTYNIRFFANDTYQKLATSATINVAQQPAQPTLSINDVSVNEGNSGSANATFTVTLSPVNASQTVTVAYATANGTAAAGSDYTAANGTLTFAPSVATQTITVPVTGDVTIEGNETFVVNLSAATNAVIGDGQGSGTIVNDDAPAGPAVTVSNLNVNPGGTISFTVSGGPANPTDWVSLSLASSGDMSPITWVYLNGSTSAPATGTANASLQFTAPATQGTYNIRFFANNTYQKLATSANINVAQQAAQPTLSINDVSLNEGNSGSANATFTVTLSPVNASQTVTVAYATANGTATAGSDYTAANGTLTFAPSVATQTITVPVTGDATVEGNETFVINLSGATNAAIGDGQGIGTIVNDDAAAGPSGPAVTLSAPNVNPGGTINFTISGGPANPTDWVSLSLASAADSSPITWIYLNGSNAAPATGTANASLHFTAPTTPGTYNIRFFANNTYQKLATSANINVAQQPAQPTLTINDVTVTEGNSGSTTATFTVSMSPVNASQTVTVDYATANGTATTANNDYTATTGTLTFGPSVATQTITVPVIGDGTVEDNESFVVNLSNAVNAVIGDGQGIGTINTDDVPPGPAVTINSVNITPGATINFQISNAPGNPRDWVGLYRSGDPDAGSQLQWKYLNNSNTPPSSGLTNASLTMVAPATPGTYNIRLLANDGYTRIAISSTFTVSP